MKCPLCSNEMMISGGRPLVQKTDGTLAYRLKFVCRTKECPNYNNVVYTQYDPVIPVVEEE